MKKTLLTAVAAFFVLAASAQTAPIANKEAQKAAAKSQVKIEKAEVNEAKEQVKAEKAEVKEAREKTDNDQDDKKAAGKAKGMLGKTKKVKVGKDADSHGDAVKAVATGTTLAGDDKGAAVKEVASAKRENSAEGPKNDKSAKPAKDHRSARGNNGHHAEGMGHGGSHGEGHGHAAGGHHMGK